MHAAEVINALNPASPEDLFKYWDDFSTYAGGHALPHFTAEEVLVWAQNIGLPEAAVQEACALADEVSNKPEFLALARYGHWLSFISPANEADKPPAVKWPAQLGRLAERSGLFYLLVVLSGVEVGRPLHEKKRIPAAVTKQTFADVLIWLARHWRITGRYGIEGPLLNWFRHHFQGNLYQLGRLQFARGAFKSKIKVFRRRPDGLVLALAMDGMEFRPDGQVNGAGGVFAAPAEIITAGLRETEEAWTGLPIHPKGYAVLQPVVLSKRRWVPVLQPQDQVLHMHIPESGPMDHEACGRSIKEALQFFPAYFPDEPPLACCCTSWILDNQFEDILPPQANMVRFQKELYLVPARTGNMESTLKRIFGAVPDDLAQAPRDTTLRRAVLEHLERGGHLRGGSGFLLPQDYRWGEQVYRSQGLPF